MNAKIAIKNGGYKLAVGRQSAVKPPIIVPQQIPF
jgi:hypothetical protein